VRVSRLLHKLKRLRAQQQSGTFQSQVSKDSLFPDHRELSAALQPRFFDVIVVVDSLLAQILGEIVRGHVGIPQRLAIDPTVPDQRGVVAFDEKAQGWRTL
jgi:hypothetical protein